MKNVKSLLSIKTVVFALCAAALIGLAGAGLSRASLQVTGGEYTAQIGTQNIGVALLEGERLVSQSQAEGATHGTILSHLLEEGETQIVPGKTYEELLSVKNTGDIDEYVRVIIKKRWQNQEGVPLTTLAPQLIDLHLLTTENGGAWLLDESASTKEQIVLYYTGIIPVEGTAAFADTLRIDEAVMKAASMKEESQVITLTYAYQDAVFAIDVEVDAVQTNNAEKAILSAWGKEVSIDENGVLSLKEGGAQK
ncbi:MAG: hypothetical protein HFE64_05430 [Lachnospiraceae bacterium]|jgi:hypothetical protein|nr:hypothetical protein [Lachnospiraceae bacterium]